MADNFTTKDASSASITGGADDIGGVKYPRIKLIYGPDGTNSGDVDTGNPLPVVQTGTPGLPTGAAMAAKQDTGNTSLGSIDTKLPSQGQALAAASIPVVLPADQITALTPPAAITGFATETTLGEVLTTSDFDTKTGSLTETAPASDTASSGVNGRLQRIAQRITSLITALGSPFQAGGSIGNTSFAATQATGTNLHTVVDSGTITTLTTLTGTTTLTPGTGAANLGKAEDAVHGSGDTGVAMWGVSNENSTAFGAASGDYGPIATNRYGAVYVTSWTPSHASSNGTPITATTTSVVAAPSAGNHLRVVRIHLSNGGSTSTWVSVRDGASGTQHYRTFLPQNGVVSLNLRLSGPLDLTTATRLDIVLSAAGSVEYEIDYLTVAD